MPEATLAIKDDRKDVFPEAAARTTLSIRAEMNGVAMKSPKTEASQRAVRTRRVRLKRGESPSNETGTSVSKALNPKRRERRKKVRKGMSFGLMKACPQKSGCVAKSNAAPKLAF